MPIDGILPTLVPDDGREPVVGQERRLGLSQNSKAMSKVPQHLIDEATRRGIVEGATIRCVTALGSSESVKLCGVVRASNGWRYSEGTGPSNTWISVGNDNGGTTLFAYWNNRWATVITPAPAPEGLKEGDAVECGPAMRAAIIELAKELGLPVGDRTEGNGEYNPSLQWGGGVRLELRGIYDSKGAPHWWSNEFTKPNTPEAFIAKMRVTASLPRPIKIDGHKVEWMHGHIRVGRQTIANDIVRAIAAKLIDP